MSVRHSFASSRLMAETRASSFVAKALQSFTIPTAFVALELQNGNVMNNTGKRNYDWSFLSVRTGDNGFVRIFPIQSDVSNNLFILRVKFYYNPF